MLSNVSVPLLGLVDTAILGHLPDNQYLAAVAMGSSLLVLVLWSFAFLRMGTTALIARNYRDTESITMTMHSAMALAIVIGITLMMISPLLIQLMLSLVSGPEPIEVLAHEYLSIRFYFSPITLMNYALLGYFIGKGLTHISLILLVSANTMNGLLNYLFVYQLDMFSSGVAWGTNFSELFQCLLGLYLINDPIFKKVQWQNIQKQFRSFLSLNIQLFIRTALLLFAFAFFMAQGAKHSAVLLSANAIMINLLMFISNGLDGFALASESLIGKAIADKKTSRIKTVITASGQWSFISACLFSLILFLFTEEIFSLLTSQVPVLALLQELKFWLIFLPIVGFACYWLDGIYIGLAEVHEMKNSLIFALFFIFLPLVYLLQFMPVHGLWLAMYGFLFSRAFWLFSRLPTSVQRIVS
jgi:MATE family multidrug resistance protein